VKQLDHKSLLNITRLFSVEECKNYLVPWLAGRPAFGWDVETTVEKTFFARKMRTMQFGDQKQQFIVDLLDLCDGDSALLAEIQGNYGLNLFAAPKVEAFLALIQPFLCTNKSLKIGVNLGFEYTCMYWGFGMSTWGFYGCDIVERLRAAGSHSLEDFHYFSMSAMCERYFDVEIDKTLQTSFDLSTPLTQEQIEYACLDTRLPIALRYRQLNGYFRPNGSRVPSIVEEGLERISQIENNCIMSFEQMHIHGERFDRESWKAILDSTITKRTAALAKLDEIAIPFVGAKKDVVTDEIVYLATQKWKAIANTKDPERIKLKAHAVALGKMRTFGKDMLKDAQGEALINYGSPKGMLDFLRKNFPELTGLTSTNDEDMLPFASYNAAGTKKVRDGSPIIDALRDYREYDKKITTYGEAWMTEWATHPCNDEGYLSPFDGRLHSRYNQLAAETGRSSSDQPNGQNVPREKEYRKCFIADIGEVYVTCDMSGAELRILAELSNAKIWIDAFANGEDVHSVCCEILFPVEWHANALDNCAYYAVNPTTGKPAHQKCKCPLHDSRRTTTKTLNFGIAYGMVAATLARRAEIPIEEAELVIEAWMNGFSDIWQYLEGSGRSAKRYMKSFDMFGRRRTFPLPTTEDGRNKIIKYWKDTIKVPPHIAEANITKWMEENAEDVINKKTGAVTKKLKKPTGETKFWLTHREPTEKEITKAIRSIMNGVERQGKNLPMQSTNVSIAKLAMGCGFDPDGKPYLFHILPQYKARLVKFVHDELVAASPEEHGQAVAEAIADAFKRAAAEVMTKVTMEAEFKVSKCWEK
jgi:DNA polymerase I-like protein with 3'-5' exonuclease and polymerase domains